MARAKRARRYGPGESLPGKVPLPRAEDEGGTCGGRVGGWSGEVEGGGRVMARHRARRSVGLAEVIYKFFSLFFTFYSTTLRLHEVWVREHFL